MKYRSIIQSWQEGSLAEDHPDVTPEQRRVMGLLASGHATDAQLEAAGKEFVFGVKTAPEFFQYRDTLHGPIGKADGNSPVIPWVLSDESVDRMGDIIRQKGWNLKNFKRSPVLLWGHDSSGEPIGRVNNIRIFNPGTKAKTPKGVSLVGDMEFAVEASENAAQKFRLAKAGFLKAGSVGFVPEKITIIDDEDKRAELGLGKWGVVFEKQELLEFSIVSVPANPNALQLSAAVRSGSIQTTDADWLAARSDPSEKEWEKLLRRKARGFVSFATEPSVVEFRLDATQSPPIDLTTTIGDLAVYPSFEVSDGPTSEDIKQNTEAMHELASSQKMIARAITDFGGQLVSNKRASTSPEEGDATLDSISRFLTERTARLKDGDKL